MEWQLVKLPSKTAKSLCKCGTIFVEGLMSVDEMDTILINQEHDRQHTCDKSQFNSRITHKWTEINKNMKFLKS